MALCLELLNTSGWAREGAWDDSRFVDSFSMEEGVFPSSTARSILVEERRQPAEVNRSCHSPCLYYSSVLPPATRFVLFTLNIQ